MNLYSIKVKWDQNIIEFIAQDESRSIGHKRVESTLLIVATSKDDAVKWTISSLKYQNPMVSEVSESKLTAIIQTSILYKDMISPDKNVDS